jgi:hypothetical protein
LHIYLGYLVICNAKLTSKLYLDLWNDLFLLCTCK